MNSDLELTPRHEWLRMRVIDIIKSMSKLEAINDWETYRKLALEFSNELNYATVEWERYYK